MFEKLKNKWKVGSLDLTLILCTFAIGGSLTGYCTRKILSLMDFTHSGVSIFLYIVLLTLLWPVMVILVSIPFGQFRFFKHYLQKIARRMRLIKPKS
jgi:ACR3 family arsenite efflux pump ArsB